MDRLEVHGEVVDGREETTSKDEGKGGGDPVGPLLDQLGADHGPLTLPPLEKTPGGNDQDKTNEESDDSAGVPGVRDTTVLDSKEEANSGSHDESDTGKIHLADLLDKGGLLRDSMGGSLEEKEDEESSHTTNGKVDVEAPSPRDMICESTTQERSNDATEPISCTKNTGKSRPLLRRRSKGNDRVTTGTQTRSTNTGNCPAGNERVGGWCGTANHGADLKDEDGDEEGDLEREVLVDLAPGGLEGSDGHEEGGAVPADFVETLELVRDLGDGGCNDGLGWVLVDWLMVR